MENNDTLIEMRQQMQTLREELLSQIESIKESEK